MQYELHPRKCRNLLDHVQHKSNTTIIFFLFLIFTYSFFKAFQILYMLFTDVTNLLK